MKRKMFLMILILSIIMVPNTVAFASDDNIIEAEPIIMDSEIIDNINVQQIVDEYFDIREEYLETDKETLDYSLKSNTQLTDIEEKVLVKGLNNITTKTDLEELFGIQVVDTEVVTSVEKINKSLTRNSTSYDMDIYEWTWVYYNYTDNLEIDKMGYGITHEIVVDVDEEGIANIVQDEYEDFIFSETNGFAADGFVNIESVEEDLVSPTSIYASNLNVNTLIDYADQYVAKSYATSAGVSGSQSYNTDEYYYVNGSDCANYVSQCLRAGLMPIDKGTNNSYDTSSSATDDWWYNHNLGTTLGECSSYSWRTVDGLINYLEQEGLTLDIIATDQSNIFPGNPVITGNEGHVAICVGYNSSGKPIINGHTRDVYHTPVARGDGGSYYYTFRIFARNTMEQTPLDATSLSFTTASQLTSATIVPKASKYYKFTVSSTDDYQIRFGVNDTNTECTAVIYKKTQTSNTYTLHMVEKNRGTSLYGLSTLTTSLSSGEYYIRFFHNSVNNRGLTLYYQIV